MKFKVGDIVKGINNNSYGITNQDMYKGKIIKIRKKEILDKAEKRYLKFVIKPFRDNIKCVVKHNYIISPSLNKYYEGINIVMKDTQIIEFPFFKVDTMYKNMKIDKEYSLEELGI